MRVLYPYPSLGSVETPSSPIELSHTGSKFATADSDNMSWLSSATDTSNKSRQKPTTTAASGNQLFSSPSREGKQDANDVTLGVLSIASIVALIISAIYVVHIAIKRIKSRQADDLILSRHLVHHTSREQQQVIASNEALTRQSKWLPPINFDVDAIAAHRKSTRHLSSTDIAIATVVCPTASLVQHSQDEALKRCARSAYYMFKNASNPTKIRLFVMYYRYTANNNENGNDTSSNGPMHTSHDCDLIKAYRLCVANNNDVSFASQITCIHRASSSFVGRNGAYYDLIQSTIGHVVPTIKYWMFMSPDAILLNEWDKSCCQQLEATRLKTSSTPILTSMLPLMRSAVSFVKKTNQERWAAIQSNMAIASEKTAIAPSLFGESDNNFTNNVDDITANMSDKDVEQLIIESGNVVAGTRTCLYKWTLLKEDHHTVRAISMPVPKVVWMNSHIVIGVENAMPVQTCWMSSDFLFGEAACFMKCLFDPRLSNVITADDNETRDSFNALIDLVHAARLKSFGNEFFNPSRTIACLQNDAGHYDRIELSKRSKSAFRHLSTSMKCWQTLAQYMQHANDSTVVLQNARMEKFDWTLYGSYGSWKSFCQYAHFYPSSMSTISITNDGDSPVASTTNMTKYLSDALIGVNGMPSFDDEHDFVVCFGDVETTRKAIDQAQLSRLVVGDCNVTVSPIPKSYADNKLSETIRMLYPR